MMLNYQRVSPEHVAHEWSAWYRPSVRRPSSRAPSIDVCLPSSGRSDVSTNGRSWSSRGIDYADVLYHHYSYPSNGRQVFPINTPLFDTFVGRIGARGLWNVRLPHWIPGAPLCRPSAQLRSIKVRQPAVIMRLQVGTVARVGSLTIIHNLEGRMVKTTGSTLQIDDAHHYGKNCHSSSCKVVNPLPSHVRIVYIDTRKFRWCSVDSVAFHSSAWPRSTREARGITRTLFTNHCNWVGMLIVRGRCFGSHIFCLRTHMLLEHLLWNWASAGPP